MAVAQMHEGALPAFLSSGNFKCEAGAAVKEALSLEGLWDGVLDWERLDASDEILVMARAAEEEAAARTANFDFAALDELEVEQESSPAEVVWHNVERQAEEALDSALGFAGPTEPQADLGGPAEEPWVPGDHGTFDFDAMEGTAPEVLVTEEAEGVGGSQREHDGAAAVLQAQQQAERDAEARNGAFDFAALDDLEPSAASWSPRNDGTFDFESLDSIERAAPKLEVKAPKQEQRAPPVQKRRCLNCGQRTEKGRVGLPGSEYAGKWYCSVCWEEWELDERGGKCSHPSCSYRRHSSQGHPFCCKFCPEGKAHGAACERRPYVRRKQPKKGRAEAIIKKLTGARKPPPEEPASAPTVQLPSCESRLIPPRIPSPVQETASPPSEVQETAAPPNATGWDSPPGPLEALGAHESVEQLEEQVVPATSEAAARRPPPEEPADPQEEPTAASELPALALLPDPAPLESLGAGHPEEPPLAAEQDAANDSMRDVVSGMELKEDKGEAKEGQGLPGESNVQEESAHVGGDNCPFDFEALEKAQPIKLDGETREEPAIHADEALATSEPPGVEGAPPLAPGSLETHGAEQFAEPPASPAAAMEELNTGESQEDAGRGCPEGREPHWEPPVNGSSPFDFDALDASEEPAAREQEEAREKPAPSDFDSLDAAARKEEQQPPEGEEVEAEEPEGVAKQEPGRNAHFDFDALEDASPAATAQVAAPQAAVSQAAQPQVAAPLAAVPETATPQEAALHAAKPHAEHAEPKPVEGGHAIPGVEVQPPQLPEAKATLPASMTPVPAPPVPALPAPSVLPDSLSWIKALAPKPRKEAGKPDPKILTSAAFDASLVAKCARNGCSFQRHPNQSHGYCCNFCRDAKPHGPACMRKLFQSVAKAVAPPAPPSLAAAPAPAPAVPADASASSAPPGVEEKQAVAYWGIVDVKYDPRLPKERRVTVLELGDGQTSGFSQHGRPIRIRYENGYCSERHPLRCAVLVENKKVTHDRFVREGCQHLRPPAACYPRKYWPGLGRQMLIDLGFKATAGPGEAVVLKLCNRSRGAGVVVAPIQRLDWVLKQLLTPPLGDSLRKQLARGQSDVLQRGFKESFEESLLHWWSNECPFFIAESCCHSVPVSPEGKGQSFDGTMRVSFVLKRSDKGPSAPFEVDWLGGYWKLPRTPLSSGSGIGKKAAEESLEQVSARTVSSFNSAEKLTAEVSPGHLAEVCEALTGALPKVFRPAALDRERLVGDYRREEPLFCAFVLARLSASVRGGNVEESEDMLRMARGMLSKYDTGTTTVGDLATRAAASYVERNAAICCALQGNWSRAHVFAEKALRASPWNSSAHYIKGVILHEKEETADAASSMVSSVLFDPDFKLPYLALGTYRLLLGDFDSAVEASRACLQRHDSPTAHLNRGQGLYHSLFGKMGGKQEQSSLCKEAIDALRISKERVPDQWHPSHEAMLQYFVSKPPERLSMHKAKVCTWNVVGWRP